MLNALLTGATILGTLPFLADMWDEGEAIGAPAWTKAGKRRMASSAGLRMQAEDEMFGTTADMGEDLLAQRLSEIAGLGRGMNAPSGYAGVRDAAFMREVSTRYRRELQDASLVEGPSIMELAAKTGLI